MKKATISLATAIVTTMTMHAGYGKAPAHLDYDSLNLQAAAEYNEAIRPGHEGRNPYWNEFAVKFTYAPAFGLTPVKGAVSYRYTIEPDTMATETITGDELRIVSDRFEPISFLADRPDVPLTPVWHLIPASHVILTVEAIDRKGRSAGIAGTRKFLRDFGFRGPYRNPVRPYREAAVKGMMFIHNMAEVQSWLTSELPDLSYTYYAYANKIISAVIRNEVLVASHVPDKRDEALRIAEAAAGFLISQSQPPTAALAYFPPTYYSGTMAGAMDENHNATMTMDANYAVQAFLDLYDATGKREYYDRAINITRTYSRLQRRDGSFPIKVSYLTGQPVSETGAMLHSICMVAERFRRQYGETEFIPMQRKAEEWMHDVAIARFDMNAQFEDVSVLGLRPYENLTNYVAANYARYLMDKEHPTEADIQDARELLILSEDQFTHWECLPNERGYHKYNTPCVMEQYKFREPVDNSASNVSGAFLAYYRTTGDTLAYAKAKALVDNMTIQQNPQTGFLPTYWEYRNERVNELNMWANCAYTTIERLLEFDAMQP